MKRPKKSFEDTVASAREAAAQYLSRREHAARELAFKLGRKGYSSPVIDQTLDDLRGRDWLNEARYAGFIARHRCAQGRGPRWVKAELQAQGITDEDCQQALAQDEVDWVEACARALSRCRAADPQPKRVQKLYQRGFDSEHIAQALARLEDPV